MTLRNSGRRAFLRGMGGLALGLPLLEYTHEKAWAATTGGAKRLVVVFNHGGDPTKAKGYFKNVSGETIDEFDVTRGP